MMVKKAGFPAYIVLRLLQVSVPTALATYTQTFTIAGRKKIAGRNST